MLDLTAVVSVITVFGTGFLIVAVIMWVEYHKSVMRSQERLAAIEKGILPAAIQEKPDANYSCRTGRSRKYRGIVTLFVGIGLSIALYINAGAEAAVWGLFVAFVAIGQLVHGYIAFHEAPNDGASAP